MNTLDPDYAAELIEAIKAKSDLEAEDQRRAERERKRKHTKGKSWKTEEVSLDEIE